ncbi:MAG: hypothetical protein Q9171_007159 [Xanthocarpia ochracea]
MTDPSGHQRCFQDKIHALSLLTSAQPKAVTKVRWRPNYRGEEKYLHYLDRIAKLIAAKADNSQAVATTYFRCPKSIRILWALGGSGVGPSSHLVSHGVDDYVKGLRRRLFECDDLQEVLRYIVHECKPTILRQFKDILRCIARDNLHAIPIRKNRPTKARCWSQELQMLVRETQQHLVKRLSPATLKDEYTANYHLFIQKVSDIDEGTSCGELADLLVYSYFLPKNFGKSAPISVNLRELLIEAGRYWGICKDLSHYIVRLRKTHPETAVEFQQLVAPPPQTITHHVSPLIALAHSEKSRSTSREYTLPANISTFNHIPLYTPLCPTSTTTYSPIPHPELLIANYMFNDYIAGPFRCEQDIFIGTSRPVCHWCSLYLMVMDSQLFEEYSRQLPRWRDYYKRNKHGHHMRSGRFRGHKKIVVTQVDEGKRESDWHMPAGSPECVRKWMEVFVDGEIGQLAFGWDELGRKTKEERDFEDFELSLGVAERNRKMKEELEKEAAQAKRSQVEAERREAEKVEEKRLRRRMWRMVEKEVGGVMRWVWQRCEEKGVLEVERRLLGLY